MKNFTVDVDFKWERPNGGFLFYPSRGRSLLRIGDRAEDVRWRRTWPLRDCPNLFLDFIQREETRDDLARFATMNGSLRGPLGMLSPTETFDEWLAEVRALRLVHRLWNDRGTQSERIKDGSRKRKDGSLLSFKTLVSADPLPRWCRDGAADQRKMFRVVGAKSRAEAARTFAQRILNRLLEQETRVALLQVCSTQDYAVELQPKNLIGAMALQCAQGMAGDANHRRCLGCGRWFAGKKADAKTCGTACRKRKSRAEKEAASRHTARL